MLFQNEQPNNANTMTQGC